MWLSRSARGEVKIETPGACAGRSCVGSSCSGVLQIRRRLFAALGDDVVGHALALIEGAHARTLHRADVHEHVARSVRRSDEAEALLRIEELHGTCCHDGDISLDVNLS